MKSPQAHVIEGMFQIIDKEGNKVPFRLTPVQKALDEDFGQRNLIIKPRQKGCSSYILARYAVDCMTIPGTRAVIISHESEATKRLFDRVHYYLQNLQGPPPCLERESRTELYFPKTSSTFYIGTAGAKALGRGDTITRLHLSEYGWWEGDAMRHAAGLFQAVPQSGVIVVESTGNGRSNDLYQLYLRREVKGYKFFFFPWFYDDEYQLTPPEGWTLTSQDTEHYVALSEMVEKYNLTQSQLYWYYLKLMDFNDKLSLLQQEYPSTPDEAFQSTGGALFRNVTLTPPGGRWVTGVKNKIAYQYLSDHPQPNLHYVLGADPSGGTGNNDAAFHIFCVETHEQVLRWKDKWTDPVAFAYTIIEFGKEYNEAYIICEENNHGLAVIPILKLRYPRSQLYKRTPPSTAKVQRIKYGWTNSPHTKPEMEGLLQEMLNEGIIIYDQDTYNELLSYTETQEGKTGGPSDNLVIALGLACIGLRRKEIYRQEYLTPAPLEVKYDPRPNLMTVSYEDIIKRLPKKNKGGIFPNQVSLN